MSSYNDPNPVYVEVGNVMVTITRGEAGLYYGTSPSVGLLVVGNTVEEVKAAIPVALTELDQVRKSFFDLFRESLSLFGQAMVLYNDQGKELASLKSRLEVLEADAARAHPDMKAVAAAIEKHHEDEKFDLETDLLMVAKEPVLHRGGTVNTVKQFLVGEDNE